MVWESIEDGDDGGHRAVLHVFGPEADGRWSRRRSDHVQYHHPDERVRAALAATGLELVLTQGQRDEGPRDDHFDEATHTKRVYLARRP
jgi:predicted TPR repeat methyltransferase